MRGAEETRRDASSPMRLAAHSVKGRRVCGAPLNVREPCLPDRVRVAKGMGRDHTCCAIKAQPWSRIA